MAKGQQGKANKPTDPVQQPESFKYLGERLAIVMRDGRIVQGYLAIVDGRGNLILLEAMETRQYHHADGEMEEITKHQAQVSVNLRDVAQLKKMIVVEGKSS